MSTSGSARRPSIRAGGALLAALVLLEAGDVEGCEQLLLHAEWVHIQELAARVQVASGEWQRGLLRDLATLG